VVLPDPPSRGTDISRRNREQRAWGRILDEPARAVRCRLDQTSAVELRGRHLERRVPEVEICRLEPSGFAGQKAIRVLPPETSAGIDRRRADYFRRATLKGDRGCREGPDDVDDDDDGASRDLSIHTYDRHGTRFCTAGSTTCKDIRIFATARRRVAMPDLLIPSTPVIARCSMTTASGNPTLG
jgi:hypothetical protein